MNINFNSSSHEILSYFNKTSLPSLSIQHKKILGVVALAFSILAACYAAYHYFYKKNQTQVPQIQTQTLPRTQIINEENTNKKMASIETLKTLFTPITDTEQLFGQPEPGLNLEGKCKNSHCETYNQLRIIPKGLGDFHLSWECSYTSCPCCQSEIHFDDINSMILDSCRFEIEGMNTKKQSLDDTFEIASQPHPYLRLDMRDWHYIHLKITKLT